MKRLDKIAPRGNDESPTPCIGWSAEKRSSWLYLQVFRLEDYAAGYCEACSYQPANTQRLKDYAQLGEKEHLLIKGELAKYTASIMCFSKKSGGLPSREGCLCRRENLGMVQTCAKPMLSNSHRSGINPRHKNFLGLSRRKEKTKIKGHISSTLLLWAWPSFFNWANFDLILRRDCWHNSEAFSKSLPRFKAMETIISTEAPCLLIVW